MRADRLHEQTFPATGRDLEPPGAPAEGIITADENGVILSANRAAEAMYGYDEGGLIGLPIRQLSCVEQRPLVDRYYEGVRAGEEMLTGASWLEATRLRRDGTPFPAELTVRTERQDGRPRVISMSRDLSQRFETEAALRESERRFRELADGAPFVIYVTDEHFHTVFVNRAMLAFTGRTLEEQLAMPLGVNRHPDDARALRETSSGAIARRERFTTEQRFRNAAGEYRWLMTDALPRVDHTGRYAGFIGYSVDITERREAEDALRESRERLRSALLAEHERARHDALTGLLNHGAISDELARLVAEELGGAVLMVDVDGMKAVNDTFGHPMGDALLQHVATSLEDRGAIVGRFGGDEFVAVLPGAGRRDAERYRDAVAQRLASADLRDPESGARIGVAASIGIAVFPEDAARIEELLQLADDAMYASKRERTLEVTTAQRTSALDRAVRLVGDLVPLLAHAGSLDDKLHLAAQHIVRRTGYEAVSFDVFDEGTARLRDANATIATNAFLSAPPELIEQWRAEQRTVVDHPLGAILERTGRPVIVDDVAANTLLTDGQRTLLTSAGIRSGIVVPLLWQGDMIGTMSVGSTSATAFGARDGQFLAAIATHISAIVRMERMVAHLQRVTGRLAGARDDTIALLAASVETHDPSVTRHLRNVRELTASLAREMGYALDAAEDLGLAAMLHDIGKVRVPEAILTGSGRLTEDEWLTMRQHTIWGAGFLAERAGFELASLIARAHHERWDGSGYPFGLLGPAIPEEATIVAVADAFDAITSDRPYRASRSLSEAVREIAAGSGTQFSPAVVSAFVRLYRRRALPIPETAGHAASLAA